MSDHAARDYQVAIDSHHNPFELPGIASSFPPPPANPHPSDSVLDLDDISIQRPKAVYLSIRPGRTTEWIRDRRRAMHFREQNSMAAPVESVRSLSMCSEDPESQTVDESSRSSCGDWCGSVRCAAIGLIGLVIVAVIVTAWVMGGRD